MNGIHGSTVAIYWDSAWRHNQKEVEAREKIFADGVNNFFRQTDCVRTTKISRVVGNKQVSISTDAEIIADSKSSGADKTVIMRIEELGPTLTLYLSPILWQTRNEVLLRVRVIDNRTESIDADTTSHWYRGGPFLLIGAGSLHRDLDGTLSALFLEIKR